MSQRKAPLGSYKDALRAKGILPIPPCRELRTAGVGAREIFDPALAKGSAPGLIRSARGEARGARSAT